MSRAHPPVYKETSCWFKNPAACGGSWKALPQVSPGHRGTACLPLCPSLPVWELWVHCGTARLARTERVVNEQLLSKTVQSNGQSHKNGAHNALGVWSVGKSGRLGWSDVLRAVVAFTFEIAVSPAKQSVLLVSLSRYSPLGLKFPLCP